MKEQNDIPREVTHPDTGAKMVLDETQGSRAMQHRLERNIGIAEGGRNVLAAVREKEAEYGYIYKDPVTGYQARIKPGGGGGGDQARQGDRGQAERGQAGAESHDDKVARLRAELAALENR